MTCFIHKFSEWKTLWERVYEGPLGVYVMIIQSRVCSRCNFVQARKVEK